MPPLGISNVAKAPPSKALAWSRLRGPIASVGTGVCKYADTFGPATPSGVRGYVGPPASSLQQPTAWYVRTTGSNFNGGSSNSAAAERSGSDAVTNGTTTITSATAAFTAADVGKGICINTGVNARRHTIVSVTNATTIIVDRVSSNASGIVWAIGGAWADIRAVIGDAAITAGPDLNSPVRSGDTVYVGAGTYRAVYASGAVFSPYFNGQVNIVGDIYGIYTGDAGMVQFTAYLTNDKTAPSGTTLLNIGGKSNLTFRNIFFVGGGASIVTSTSATSQNITFQDCAFLPAQHSAQRAMTFTNAFNTAFNLNIDRCYFLTGGNTSTILLTLTSGIGPDYDVTSYIQNSMFISNGATAAIAIAGGASAAKGGGVRIRNCTGIGPAFVVMTASQGSLIFPCIVNNCMLMGQQGTLLIGGTSGQLIEDYNILASATPRATTPTGTHSISDGSYAPLIHFGQERIWNALLRPFAEPMASSPLLGFGNDGGQTRYDLANRPRPSGGLTLPTPSVGALERANTAVRAVSPTPPVGTYDWQFTGPGVQEFLLPVDTTATILAVVVQRDSAYSAPPGAGLPAMQIVENPRLGITGQRIVDTGIAGVWNTLTAVSFTPTATGWITVRLISYDGSGAGVVSFANLSVT